MRRKRDVKTCDRCRQLKLRCDRSQPACRSCSASGLECSLGRDSSSIEAGPSPSTVLTESPSSLGQFTVAYSSSSGATPSISSPPSERPGSSVPNGHITSKKRQRACLSCVRCHRLKVKCDKGTPCSRCRQSGWGNHCTYTHRTDDGTTSTDDANTTSRLFTLNEDAATSHSVWYSKHRGSSHWKNLLPRLGFIGSVHSPILVRASEDIASMAGDCHAVHYLPGNYPFNSPGARMYNSDAAVKDLIQRCQGLHSTFIDSFMNIFQPMHPVVHTASFVDQVERFRREQTSVNPAWLAMFLMVLALGAFGLGEHESLATDLCYAAEACLSQTPFMFRPTIDSLRTVCLMAIAKQMISATCWALDSCWTFMGVVVRMAVNLGLHMQTSHSAYGSCDDDERQSNKDLWATVIYFGVQSSLVTGMPSLLTQEEILQQINPPPTALGPGSDRSKIFEASLPTVLEIVSQVNAEERCLSYEDTLAYNQRMREAMEQVGNVADSTPLRITVDIFFRRALLVLHRRYAFDPAAPRLYPVSYWASLECSLALLVHHRDLVEGKAHGDGLTMLSSFFMVDFFAAAVTTCIHLMREDAPLAAGFAIPPRRTIIDTLAVCTGFWAEQRHKSACLQAAYQLLESLLSVTPDIDPIAMGSN